MRHKISRVTWIFWAVVGGLPVALPAFIAGFGVVAIILLLMGRLDNALVWPLGVIAGLIAAWSAGRYGQAHGHNKLVERRLCDILALIGVSVWALFNSLFTAQNVFTNRDPATYAVAGQWLVHHNSLVIPWPHVFDNIAGLTPISGGFAADGGHIYAQGLHLLPVLLGLAGRIFGEAGIFHANVVFGAIALLAIYGFGRLIARPRWALIVTAALSASMPMIYFSRDTYTEPLSAALTFGALSLLWAAQQKGRLRLWLLAGFVAGAGTLTRIDAYLTLVGLAVFGAVWLLARRGQSFAVLQVMALGFGGLLSGLIGWLDVSHLSRIYYFSLRPLFLYEVCAIVAALIIGSGLAWHNSRSKWFVHLGARTKSWRGGLLALLVIVFALLLSVRPFLVWYVSHLNALGQVPYGHSYAEVTTYFVAWYLGPILAGLGLAGIALSASRVTYDKRLLLLPSLLVLGLTAGLYLIKPSITADQIWASRRLLPVILPGVAVFGAVTLDWLEAHFAKNLQFYRGYSVVAAIAIIVGALFTSSPLILLRDTARLPAITDSCQQLPRNAVVVLDGLAGYEMVQPLHAYCGLPAVATVSQVSGADQATLRQAATVAYRQGEVPVLGIYGSQLSLLPANDQSRLAKLGDYSYRHLEHTYLNPPQHIITETDSLNYAKILPDGSLTPLRFNH